MSPLFMDYPVFQAIGQEPGTVDLPSLLQSKDCTNNDASWLKFDIPVKAERLRLISILLYGIFSKNENNTVQLEILYVKLPVLLAHKSLTIIRNDRQALWEKHTAQEPITKREVSLPYVTYAICGLYP